ncbi:MAG: hypothetical protein ACRD51_18655 [Candidatus Acidiferrum sp.]
MNALLSSINDEQEFVPFVDRGAEEGRLHEAIRKRESLLIWGEPGAGKSALVRRAISTMPERIAGRCLYVSGAGSPQSMLRSVAEGLVDDPLFRTKWRADTGGGSFPRWVQAQSSLRLRGLLYRAAGASQYWIFLEDMPAASHMLARIIKELMWNQKTPVYAIASSWTKRKLGHAAPLFWNDRLMLHVGPLSGNAARELLELAIKRFGLFRFELEGFREDILSFSGLMPGAIVRMCAAARDRHYHFEGRIKTRLLRVDYLLNQCEGRLDETATAPSA